MNPLMMISSVLYISILITIFNSPNYYICSAQNNSSPRNPCETSRRCGSFAICDSVNIPTCSCLPEFNPVNEQEWRSGNWTSGCHRRVPLACEGNNNGTTTSDDRFLEINRMIISGYSELWSGPETECEGRCLTNCSCSAYGLSLDVRDSPNYLGTGCVFWNGTIFDLRRNSSEPNISLHIRVPRIEPGSLKLGGVSRKVSLP